MWAPLRLYKYFEKIYERRSFGGAVFVMCLSMTNGQIKLGQGAMPLVVLLLLFLLARKEWVCFLFAVFFFMVKEKDGFSKRVVKLTKIS